MRLILTAFAIFAASASPFYDTAWASAGFPFIMAAESANGEFIVTSEIQYDNPGLAIKTIKRVTYRVLRKEHFTNEKGTSISGTYWSDSWPWGVSTDRASVATLPMVSNDGKYLVLLSLNYPYGGEVEAISIYQKDGFQAKRVATLRIKDLWTELQINPTDNPYHVFSDSSPLWFEGGSLDFSDDNRQFIYKTRWGNTVVISLSSGEAARQ